MSAKLDTGIINIHGKQYQTVAFRVQNFRTVHPDWTLKTSIVFRDKECVVMAAEIIDEKQRLIATGHAEEYRSSSNINKTSALENAETSAIGRALASLGMGGTEYCSADELVNAITSKPEVPRESAKSVAASDFEKMPEAKQKEFLSVASEVMEAFDKEGHEVAYDYYLAFKEGLDDAPDQAAWRGCFPSNIRTAFTKIYTKRNSESLATQA